jgi:hypothetical protein
MIAVMFTRSFLSDVRRRALRKGVWYTALDTLERGIISLACRLIDRVESVVLGVEIVKIMRKLVDSMKSGFVRRMEEYGLLRAREIVDQVNCWDQSYSPNWSSKIDFARYLALIEFNWPSGYGI